MQFVFWDGLTMLVGGWQLNKSLAATKQMVDATEVTQTLHTTISKLQEEWKLRQIIATLLGRLGSQDHARLTALRINLEWQVITS